mgnify:CR=1 FL=1|jgi:glycosyltransferase involved in cell wall biosynthesis|tara:strand:+ start:152304 stop:153353 length:1050 start_codon:yes stop_codon:yes gene_type:complete
MKIIHVLAGASTGGAETACIDTCIAMAKHGFDVEVITRPNKTRVPRLKEAGIKTYLLPFGGKIDAYTPWSIKGILKKSKPDIVQTWMSRAADKMPNAPANKPYKVVSRLGGYYKIKYFKNTDYFMTITPDIKRHLIENGVNPDTIRHINNFAETEQHFTKVDRADLDTPLDVKVVLTLSRLHESKALDTLMQAAQKLDDIYLWLAGEGPDRDKLQKLAVKLGMAERVKFLGWRQDRAALLAAADICCFPSRYEPFGTVFVQAWANKTPLIVSLADGPKQFVRDKEDCLAFSIDDVESLTNNLKLLRDNEALGRDLTENGYKRYCEEFSVEKTMAAYQDFFDDILAQSSK